MKEAAARLKSISFWKRARAGIFSNGNLPANIQLEPMVTIKESDLNARRRLRAVTCLPTFNPATRLLPINCMGTQP